MLRILRLFSTKVPARQFRYTWKIHSGFALFSSSPHPQSNDFTTSTVFTNLNNLDASSQYITIFQKINLDDKLISNTLPNVKLSQALANLCHRLNVHECEKRKGMFLYTIASKLTNFPNEKQDLLAYYVLSEKIQSSQQLDRAISFIKTTTKASSEKDFIRKFEEFCGIGVTFTEEAIKKTIQEYIEKRSSEFLQQGIQNVNKASHLRELRELLPGANGGLIFQIFSEELSRLPERKEESTEGSEKEENKRFLAAHKIFNLFARDMTSSINPPEILKKHLEATGGKLVTRFPPEPNGYLHLGHAKAMRFSFTAAKEYDGMCYLRYDDTNPLTESKEYVKSIEDNVQWLGYKPYKITHASDYFQQMFDFAIDLIKKGKAYICDQSSEEMQAFRKDKKPSPSRNRSPEESLDLFYRMQAGEFEEGKYCLRLKIDYANVNPTLRDPVAFRVKHHPHPQTGTKWCIFPTYDFAHCLSDSLENITHSLCTLEFEIRRDLYYWILEALNIYRPMVWEFSRLNISKTVLSKRKLAKLINLGIVKGWDDPRLVTINGMRRRGFTSQGINSFCDEISVTRRGNETMVSVQLLEHCIRKDLDLNSPRTMAVLDPVKLVITNLDEGFEEEREVHPFPKDPKRGKPYKVSLTREIYMEKSDFRDEDHPNFYGLAPGKIIGLRYADFVKYLDHVKDSEGNIKEIKVERIVPKNQKDIEELKKVKGRVHWISTKDAINCEARLYDSLFTVDNPNEAEKIEDVVNKDSLQVIKHLKFNKKLLGTFEIESKFQFERLGYFCVDPDSDLTKGELIFNRTLELIDKDKVKAIKTVTTEAESRGKNLSA